MHACIIIIYKCHLLQKPPPSVCFQHKTLRAFPLFASRRNSGRSHCVESRAVRYSDIFPGTNNKIFGIFAGAKEEVTTHFTLQMLFRLRFTPLYHQTHVLFLHPLPPDARRPYYLPASFQYNDGHIRSWATDTHRHKHYWSY